MNTLPEVLQNKIFNYAAQMVVAERNKIWSAVNQNYFQTLFSHIEPYLVLEPEVFDYGLTFRHGPYKHFLRWAGYITEERYPLDLSEHSESASESS